MDATDLAFAGAARQIELLRAGEVSPRELVETYLRRIERLDPDLNAFRKVLAERALVEADQAAARLRAGDERPLLGIPVAVKDDVGIAGEVRTDGTNAYGGPEREDWEIVRLLRAAGAIVLGITNVPELTIWPFTETPTWGITRNPWDPQRAPGGSSGGSGAAVAAGLAPLATGSDGGGSIRIPAAFCGLAGLKPQRDRIRYLPGGGPHWHGLSVVGGIGRTVADAALFYEAVTGLPWRRVAAEDPRRLRVALSFAVPPGIIAKVEPAIRRATEEVAETLRSLGHEVVERDPDYGQVGLHWSIRWLAGISDDAASMPHPERLEPRTRSMAQFGRVVKATGGLRWANDSERSDAARINALFDDVDVILGPGTATLPQRVGRYTTAGVLRTWNGISSSVPFQAVWNHVGNPAMTIPSALSAEGLPLSVQLAAAPDGEETLLALAGQIERARPWADRRPPLAS
ncbi:MAG TPA: amidase [Solirubrobacteraceae bacterium]|nr:amidase [Solirubrobacteraceae bacterium]